MNWGLSQPVANMHLVILIVRQLEMNNLCRLWQVLICLYSFLEPEVLVKSFASIFLQHYTCFKMGGVLN